METVQKSMAEIQELIKRVRMDPRASNKPVLGINIQMIQTAKNGGYPKHMYHEHLNPIVVLGDEEEQAVAREGFVTHYIRHSFPKWKFRRNMDKKFSEAGFIEAVEVKTSEVETNLLKRPVRSGAGKWFDKSTDIDPLPDEAFDDPSVTIAHLEGQLAELRAQAATSGKAARG